MSLRSSNCPNCGASVRLLPGSRNTTCVYCSSVLEPDQSAFFVVTTPGIPTYYAQAVVDKDYAINEFVSLLERSKDLALDIGEKVKVRPFQCTFVPHFVSNIEWKWDVFVDVKPPTPPTPPELQQATSDPAKKDSKTNNNPQVSAKKAETAAASSGDKPPTSSTQPPSQPTVQVPEERWTPVTHQLGNVICVPAIANSSSIFRRLAQRSEGYAKQLEENRGLKFLPTTLPAYGTRLGPDVEPATAVHVNADRSIKADAEERYQLWIDDRIVRKEPSRDIKHQAHDKLLYLPIWHFSYDYEGRTYDFLMPAWSKSSASPSADQPPRDKQLTELKRSKDDYQSTLFALRSIEVVGSIILLIAFYFGLARGQWMPWYFFLLLLIAVGSAVWYHRGSFQSKARSLHTEESQMENRVKNLRSASIAQFRAKIR